VITARFTVTADLADREYQPGDDIRYMDWNVTARMDTPYIRQYTEEREVTAWFLLDLSPSVDFGGVQSLKRTVLIDFVATLARLLTRHGNRVGAVLYGSRIERTIPAGSGRNQVLRLVSDLLSQPRLLRAPFTDLTPLIAGSLNAIKRRSLIFIVSDFISAPGWERPLSLLNRRHDVLAVRLWIRASVTAGHWTGDYGGLRDWRTAVRGYARSTLPPAFRAGGRAGVKRPCHRPSNMREWMHSLDRRDWCAIVRLRS
jgi:uncharacterized protein (DUF58 family)